MSLNIARLDDRALVAVTGPGAADWLQGLVTQTVTGLVPGDWRLAAFLTPQGRLLADFLVTATPDGLLLDVDADGRDALVARLALYRLRAQAVVTAVAGEVYGLWGDGAPPSGAAPDPRLPALGWRMAGAGLLLEVNATAADYRRHRRGLGVPETAADGLVDKAYAIEANFDLLHGIDFKKGCFIGQETTSRMKRRSGVRSRVLSFTGEARAGDEIVNGALRAGEVMVCADGVGLALMRLDRSQGPLTVAGAAIGLTPPDWLAAETLNLAAPSTGQT